METSAPPCPSPVRSTAAWPEAMLEAEGHRIVFRFPPSLQPRERWKRPPSYAVVSHGPYLLASFCSEQAAHGGHHLSLWVYDRPGFPTMAYPSERQPRQHEWATCEDRIAGVDVTIATWRSTMIDAPTSYHVAAYWEPSAGIWVRLAAEAPSRLEQEELIVALRTMEVEALAGGAEPVERQVTRAEALASYPLFTESDLARAFGFLLPEEAARHLAARWFVEIGSDDVVNGVYMARRESWRPAHGQLGGLAVRGTPSFGPPEPWKQFKEGSDEWRANYLLRLSDFHLNLVSLVSPDVFERVRRLRGDTEEQAQYKREQMRRWVVGYRRACGLDAAGLEDTTT